MSAWQQQFEERPQPRSEREVLANPDAENQVAGCVLLEGAAALDRLEAALGSLGPEVFYFTPPRRVVEAARHLACHGRAIDLTTVSAWLQDQGQLEEVGGQPSLVSMIEAVVVTANLDAYTEIVLDRHYRRQLQAHAADLKSLAVSREPLAVVREQAYQAAARLYELGDRGGDGEEHWRSIAPRNYERATSPQKRIRCFPTFSARLNIYLDGGIRERDAMAGGRLIVIGAGTSIGKSTLAGALLAHHIREHRQPATLFSYEMSADQYVARLLANLGGIETWKMRRQRLDEAERERLQQLCGLDLPLAVNDRTEMDYEQLARQVELSVRRNGSNLVVIDHLHCLRGLPREDVRTTITNACRALRDVSQRLSLDIVLLAQLNRNVAERADKRPTLADLKESSGIEQYASVVLLLHRPEVYDPQTVDRNITEVIVAKNRDLITGQFRLLHNLEHLRYQDPPEEGFTRVAG